MASGEVHIAYRCLSCLKNLNSTGQWIGKETIKKLAIDIESLPIFDDYRANNPPCAVCNKRGTELHHFAPKELFPDTFEDWPKAYLCKTHHDEWHNKLTIPLRTLRNRQRKLNHDQPHANPGPTIPQ